MVGKVEQKSSITTSVSHKTNATIAMPSTKINGALCHQKQEADINISKLDAAPSVTESNAAATTKSDVSDINITTSDDTTAANSRCDKLGQNCACDHNVGYDINPSTLSIS